MHTTRTVCAHCERVTVVRVPDADTEIIGKTKRSHSPAENWETFTCRNCDRPFGAIYE